MISDNQQNSPSVQTTDKKSQTNSGFCFLFHRLPEKSQLLCEELLIAFIPESKSNSIPLPPMKSQPVLNHLKGH